MPAQALDQGKRFKTRLSTTQVPVALGASGTFANDGNGMCTLTFTSAHGLTLSPAAGVMGNYACTFSGSSGEVGGTLINNIFRIMKIPSATTVVIYSTLTAAVVTAADLIPVFFVPFTQMLGNYMGQVGPVDSTGARQPPMALTGDSALLQLGANCTWKVNYDNTALILDPVTTPTTGTPSTAPAWSTQVAASSNALVYGAYQECLWASGAAGTSYASVYN